MSVESRLKDVEESLRLLRDANRLQGRRISGTKPTDKQVYMWNETTRVLEPTTGAQILFARATSSLVLTTSYQSITGDGNSSKVRLVLPTIGDWLIEATCDLAQNGASTPGNLSGALFVDDSGTAETGEAVKTPQSNGDRATVPQRWKITTTSADTPVELKVKMSTGGGNAVCRTPHTTLVASIGIGGGSTAASDHGNLDGLGDPADHAWALLIDGSRVFTGEQSMGTNKLTNVVDPTVDQDAATKKYHDDNKYTDSAAIAAVEGEATLDLAGLIKLLLNDGTVRTDAEYIRGQSGSGLIVFDLRSGLIINLDTNANEGDAAVKIRHHASSTDMIRLNEDGSIDTNTINEITAAAGVTIDGALIKDGEIAEAAIPAAITRDSEHGDFTPINHSALAALLGRAGGQTLIGGTGSGQELTLKGTSNSPGGFGGVNIDVGDQKGLRVSDDSASRDYLDIYPDIGLWQRQAWGAGTDALLDIIENDDATANEVTYRIRMIRRTDLAGTNAVAYKISYRNLVGDGDTDLFVVTKGNIERVESTDWAPLADNTHDMGFSGRRWKDIYLGGIIKGGAAVSAQFAGQVSIGEDETPQASASVDLRANDKALLVNRLTTTQRNALTAANGHLLYNTTDDRWQVRQSGAWVPLMYDGQTAGGDLGGTYPNPTIQTATTSQKGVVSELATASETAAGTDSSRVVTPSVLPVLAQDSKYVYAEDAEASDTYAIALTPAVAAYATGQVFHFKANTANTGAATLNVNGLGAKAILKEHDVALSDGDIEAGQIVTVVYDGTQFQMQSLLGNAPGGGGGETNTGSDLGGTAGTFKQKTGVDLEFRGITGGTGITVTENATDIDVDADAASTTAAGIIELATTAEIDAATPARAITTDALGDSNYSERIMGFLISDPGGDALTTGDTKALARIPSSMNGYELVEANACVTTVSSSGPVTVQVAKSSRTNATTRTASVNMLSTPITIDVSEFDSLDATTEAPQTDGKEDVVTGDQIRIDIDAAGTGVKGLFVELIFRLK